jgi:PAS domain S-box-containing protein
VEFTLRGVGTQTTIPAASNGTTPANSLADADALARVAIEALPAAVYMTDAEGRIIFYNEAAATLWGCRPKLGHSKFCGSRKLYWPDGTPLPHDECPMAMALRQKRPIRGMEAIAERPNGARIPFIPYPTPLFDGAGRLTGAINMLVDISERKRAEADLAERQAQLAVFVENAPAAIAMFDRDMRYVAVRGGSLLITASRQANTLLGDRITISFPRSLSVGATSMPAYLPAKSCRMMKTHSPVWTVVPTGSAG